MQLLKLPARNLGLGVALYRLYHAPKGLIRRYLQRDPIRRAIDAQGQLQMEKAAYALPPLPDFGTGNPFDVYFLSGKRFWYQTCFCAYSMAYHSQVNLRPVIFDDGTLALHYQAELQRIFPNAQIISHAVIQSRLETDLPESQFPYLRQRRLSYPNLRKLTDIHIGSSGWKLVLDSDMLFFRSPTFLLNWLRSPQQPCHMVDVETAYGYSPTLMASLAGTPIPHRINAGISGLNSSTLDWDKLEFWCKTLITQEGTHYYQEQAMVAMLMAAGQPCAIAPETDYKVMPDRAEVLAPKAVLQHYVADSKPWYFRYAWKRAVVNAK
ncbi:hypothetical protein ACN4EK_26165 [Pantanalinema rosaneae CENA516]|uniref:hypothetical protein n=1 Tax=Pantanalinema rosaneae TaxID=1620701 RepID=UPI003D6F6C68